MPIRETPLTSVTVDTDILAAGDALGAKLEITSVPASGIIRAILITDVDDEAGSTQNVWFFRSEPTGIAANAAFDLVDADLELVIGNRLMDQEFDAISGRIRYEECNIPYVVDGNSLWVQLENAGGTPTYAAATDIKIKLFIEVV
tara:strand:+ start:6183 stop:6617 length:435 start_codon:yes stop_codon:yes gene_type:complete